MPKLARKSREWLMAIVEKIELGLGLGGKRGLTYHDGYKAWVLESSIIVGKGSRTLIYLANVKREVVMNTSM